MKSLYFSLLLQCCFFVIHAQIIDKKGTLTKYGYWHNKDYPWYEENIPFLETPDPDIDRTYYYRWDNFSLHLVYGSPLSGYAVTEFIDRPWWSGRYGTISCSVGHHLYEMRWLRNDHYWKDYAAYWFRTPGAQPRNYSTWLADGIWNAMKVDGDKNFGLQLKDALSANYLQWEREHFVQKEGMFAWSGMQDGMETNINSRQTPQWFEGASGYRPTLNSYMWADAKAISSIAAMGGDNKLSDQFDQKAMTIKANFQKKCWDSSKHFFLHRFQKDEVDGIKANTLTYQTGKYAGNPHGREEIGFIPWYFNMVDSGYESAWQYLMDSSYFYAPFGPACTEKGDPLFLVAKNCCAWSGNSWPFATSQTLKAMGNLLRNYHQSYVSRQDYFLLLQNFAKSQQKDGFPFIGEANDPETGSWDGHDYIGHSEHYFHSSYIDLIITGLMGLEPRLGDSVEINPLIPDNWDFACLDNIRYHGNDLTIVWDRYGTKYNKGKGLLLLANGNVIASEDSLKKIVAVVPPRNVEHKNSSYNFAVNNEDGVYFPHISASFSGSGLSYASKVNDGQYWYLSTTPNRWSTENSSAKSQWIQVDYGALRRINKIKLYFVEDSLAGIESPDNFELQYWKDNRWQKINGQKRQYQIPQSNAANAIEFPTLTTSRVRVTIATPSKKPIAIAELETWGDHLDESYSIPKNPEVPDNVLFQKNTSMSSSYKTEGADFSGLTDGILRPAPIFSFWKSPNAKDWIQINLKKSSRIKKINLYFFDDHQELRAPKAFHVEYLENGHWNRVKDEIFIPSKPLPHLNTCEFLPVQTTQVRIVFDHLETMKKFTSLYEVELL